MRLHYAYEVKPHYFMACQGLTFLTSTSYPPRPLLVVEGFHGCYLLRQILLRFPLGLYEEQETMIGGSPGGGGTA
jgi:hypothetical protein